MSKINGFLSTAKTFFESVSQKFTAPVPNELSKLSLPNDCWKNNLIEQTNLNVAETPKTNGDQKFWVEKSLDPKILRERLLRDNFHYDSQDIEAYKKKTGSPLVITDSGRCSQA